MTPASVAPPAQRTRAGERPSADRPDHGGGGHVDAADDQRPLDLAEDRQQHEREGQPAHQRPDVVGGEQVGGDVAGMVGPHLVDQRDQHRDLGADEGADEGGDDQQRRLVEVEPGEGGVEGQDGEPADQGQGGLDDGEGGQGPVPQPLGQQRPDPHAEHHDRQHDRRLVDGVADQVAAEGDQGQLVDEPAGGAGEGGGEEDGPEPPVWPGGPTARRPLMRWRRPRSPRRRCGWPRSRPPRGGAPGRRPVRRGRRG